MKRILMLAAASAALAACSTLGMDGMGRDGMAAPMPTQDGPMAMPAGSMMMPTAAMSYIRAAGESDLFEVTTSQLALQRTQNPQIRQFATKMIDHHTGTTNSLLAASKAARIPPPPAVLGPQKRAMIQQLEGQTGAAFDRLYIQGQVTGHREALGIHTNYSQSGDNGTLRAAAAAVVPIVQGHLSEVQGMQSSMGAM